MIPFIFLFLLDAVRHGKVRRRTFGCSKREIILAGRLTRLPIDLLDGTSVAVDPLGDHPAQLVQLVPGEVLCVCCCTNTIRRVTMVVAVLTTSCQVGETEEWPTDRHSRISAQAMAKVRGLPAPRDTMVENRWNSPLRIFDPCR